MSLPYLLIGSDGNMGTRYAKIMDYLGISYVKCDRNYITDWNREYAGYIIATPTDDHYSQIKQCAKFKKPILCEKAITKNRARLEELLDTVDFAMVNQYAYLWDKDSEGSSFYNYFKTGKDDLEWDCINIIGLSNKPAKLMNDSPIWQCQINGKELSIKDMDRAYCKMIEDWHKRHYTNKEYIELAHNKIWEGYYVG